jgi:hypothetical protein
VSKGAFVWFIVVAWGLQMLCFTPHAHGHSTSRSYSSWERAGSRVQVRLLVSARDLSAVTVFAPSRSLRLTAGGEPCRASGWREVSAAAGKRAFVWSIDCPHERDWLIHSRLLLGVFSNHVHFAQLSAESTDTNELLFDLGQQKHRWSEFGGQAEVDVVNTGWLYLGSLHVLQGWDHLCFLLLLCFFAQSLPKLGFLLTGFTLGHAFSLVAVAQHWLRSRQHVVEALIGASVLILAAELACWPKEDPQGSLRWKRSVPGLAFLILVTLFVWRSDPSMARALLGLTLLGCCYLALRVRKTGTRWTLVITLFFGFIHGLGIGGQLQELRLPAQRQGLSLLLFNLGVELSQLLFAGAVVLCLSKLRCYLDLRLQRACAVAVGAAAGAFWVLERSLLL